MVNGSPEIVTAACKVPNPPPVNNVAAIIPDNETQIILCMAGVFLVPPEVIPSTTSAPESAEVMMKLQISSIPKTFNTLAKGNFSKNT